MGNEIILKSVDDRKELYADLNDRIWDYAETAFSEFKSMDAICEVLAAEGFTVEKGVADVPTAFTGTWGHGKPVIGILGEYDALSGINQKSGSCIKEPTSPEMLGANGHGCAHNCLGTASLAGAVAAKDYLQATGKEGTIIYFGCPGEEGGSGKAFMARGGVFEGVDAALTWHGADHNAIMSGSDNANYQVLFKFKGIAAHAAGADRGRSALDALELMNTGVQYLREHMADGCRIHYAIIDTGGYSPNVVQPTASALYLIRAPKVPLVDALYKRVIKCAEGAAHMTETTMTIDFVKACSNMMPNAVLEKALYKNMEAVGVPSYTKEEYDLAARMITAYETPGDPVDSVINEFPADMKDSVRELYKDKPSLNAFLLPYAHSDVCAAGSTDVGDVSLNCPTAQFWAVTNSSGCPGHAWQYVAQTNTSIAHKGVWFAGKVLGATAIDLIEQPELLAAAKAEFLKMTGGEPYKCPIPEGVKPRALSAKM